MRWYQCAAERIAVAAIFHGMGDQHSDFEGVFMWLGSDFDAGHDSYSPGPTAAEHNIDPLLISEQQLTLFSYDDDMAAFRHFDTGGEIHRKLAG